MPAEVEKMFHVGETPWHGQSEELQDGEMYNIVTAIEKAGQNWSVECRPLYFKQQVSETEFKLVEVDCRQATVRSDNQICLGTVGPRYTPLQNAEAFEWFQPYLTPDEDGNRAAALHTAGSLDEGRKVWVLAKLNLDNAEIVPGDDVAKYLLLSNSHDGTLAVRVGFTPIRVVCANTLRMAHADDTRATKLIRIRHHRNMKKTLETVRNTINIANQQFEATAEQYRFLASRQVDKEDLDKYIKIVLKIEDKEDKGLATRTKNTIEDIVERFDSKGPGCKFEGVAGTWWGAYNAVTHWLNYERGHNTDTRLHSLWFGPSSATNQLALESAVEFADKVAA
jgi:phage/plasmid-like protein (TIGR03299 family)